MSIPITAYNGENDGDMCVSYTAIFRFAPYDDAVMQLAEPIGAELGGARG